MKKLLIFVFAFGIFLLYGCQSFPKDPQIIPDLPAFSNPRTVLNVTKQVDFLCPGDPSSEVVGRYMEFDGTIPGYDVRQFFGKHVFHTQDSILTRYDSLSRKFSETWIDFYNDDTPEFYFSNVDDIPDFPNICRTLETLKKNYDRKK